MSYSDDLRDSINATGLIKLKEDNSYENLLPLLFEYIKLMVRGDYLHYKNTDF